ncbi:MAG: 4-hydroxy-tetrahydrodipicolinate reductase, partial [Gammaproteobacteria bacterium]|nr:4-hydroxy-tetrahydrodipicolinate reductase [Gammaproteobacteria bacterium]
MIRIAIAGAAGRMGRSLIEAFSNNFSDSKVTVATVLDEDPSLGMDSGILAMGVANGVLTIADISGYIDDFDVLVDFTSPSATKEHVDLCQKHHKALVIGTTGLSDEQLKLVRDAGRQIPIVLSPNMSIGVNLCFGLVEVAAKAVGNQYDIEIVEAHHRDKKDSPSGTALKMGQVASETLGRNFNEVSIFGRRGSTDGRDLSTIGFSTVRAGDIVGDHT